MAEILSGAPVAAAINEKTARGVQQLAAAGISPVLALLRIGAREDDVAYENSAEKRCAKAGVAVQRITLPESVTQEQLSAEVQRLNLDPSVNGVMVFMPLPPHLDAQRLRRELSPQKDVDGISFGSLSGVFTASGEGFAPCTAEACIEMLDYYKIDCTGKNAVVIGRSLVVGKPVSMLLLGRNSTVTICHTKTRDLPQTARSADLLIAATGKAASIDQSCLSEKQVVIDVGINFANGRLCGDVDFDAAVNTTAAVTPVPGGVGAVTSALLVNHVVQAALRQHCL